MNIDTACSSSLVALDLARQSLLCGDSEMVCSFAIHVPALTHSALGHCCGRKSPTPSGPVSVHDLYRTAVERRPLL